MYLFDRSIFKHIHVACNFSTAPQLIYDGWMSRGSIVCAGEAVVSWWPHKMKLRLKATRLHRKREAALVKVTKIKDDKFAENNVCRVFPPNWVWLWLAPLWVLKYAPYFPTGGSLWGEGGSLQSCTHTCTKTCILHRLKGGFDLGERCCSSLKPCSKTYLPTACLHIS